MMNFDTIKNDIGFNYNVIVNILYIQVYLIFYFSVFILLSHLTTIICKIYYKFYCWK